MPHKQRIAFALAGAVASFARANLTPIQSPPHGEDDQAQILAHMFGGTFVADGADFSNGSINAIRMDDSHDQRFSRGQYDVEPVAKFAGPEESVEFIFGHGTSNFYRMINVFGHGYDPDGNGAGLDTIESFRFGMVSDSPETGGVERLYTSKPADNPNQQDAMITYRIKGESDKLVHYVLFFENLDPDKPGHKTRNDYNDLVLSVTKGLYQPVALPLPSAAYTGGAMLAAFLGLRVRRWVTSTA